MPETTSHPRKAGQTGNDRKVRERFIEPRGVLERTAWPGDRQDCLRLAEHPCAAVLAGALVRPRRARSTIATIAEALSAAGQATLDPRLKTFDAFYVWRDKLSETRASINMRLRCRGASHPARPRPRVVILGAGFGGLFAAKAMKRLDADITVIDRHNHHLFQPLLYQVATAGLAPSDIAWPVRSVLARQPNVSVRFGTVSEIDTARREVVLDEARVPYDHLVCATGARHSYFGHDDWAGHAAGLKSVDDATMIRRQLLLAFERAETTEDPAERDRLLRVVIVGAGPTGVELAGAIAELAHFTLAADFRHIDPRDTQVVLIEAGARVLSAFGVVSSDYARRALERKGIGVRLDTRVTACDAHGVEIDAGQGPERIESETVLWAAGVAASPVGRWLDVATDRAGRVPVQQDLSVEALPDVFVIGDAASVTDSSGHVVPGIAPAAKQQGRYVARVLRARLGGEPTPGPFRYRHAGNLATIGRGAGVAELPRLRLTGFLAWALWGVAHVYFLIGLPSPLLVTLRWLWEYATYRRGARLITGSMSVESLRDASSATEKAVETLVDPPDPTGPRPDEM